MKGLLIFALCISFIIQSNEILANKISAEKEPLTIEEQKTYTKVS